MKRKKVLIIANYFPPSGVVGVQRTLKFVKYLPCFNWEPIVLTLRKSYSVATDRELLEDIPDNVTVYRTNCWGIRCSKYISNEYYSMSQNLWRMIRKNLLRMFFFPFPDPRIGWFFPAIVSGRKIVKKAQVDLIYTTSPSHSTHYIGLFLKKLMKIPWIADFRDPWASVSNLQDNLLRHKIKRILSAIYESAIVRMTDFLITTTELTREDFLRRYSKSLPPEKTQVITCGYDEEDFNFEATEIRKNEQFTLTYTGTFQSSQSKRTPEYFLKALERIVIEEPEISKDIKVYFIGTFNQRDKKLFSEPILQNIITVKEHVTHKESILYQLKPDVLLLIQVSLSQENWKDQTLPLKLFEYIRAQKPILALAHNGATRDFIKAHNLGMTVEPMNVEEIKSAILEMYKSYKAGTLKVHCNKEFIKKFNTRNLTGELAEVLDRIVANKR